MDPLTVISIASAILAVSSKLSQISAIAGGGESVVEIRELENEVVSLQAIMAALQIRPVLDPNMAAHLDAARHTLAEVMQILGKYNDAPVPGKTRAVQHYRWIRDKGKIMVARKRLNTHISALGMLLSIEDLERQKDQGSPLAGHEILIAVMGETGSGKSSFINRILGEEAARVGHTLLSETASIQSYSVSISGRIITLVDTPGFNDTFRSETDVLRDISDWLASTYRSHLQLLSGIIYLHGIDSPKMPGSAFRNLKMFEALVGSDALRNVVLATTMWDTVKAFIGESRESELKETFWKGLIERGSITARVYPDRRSAMAILERTAFDQREGSSSGARLAIQRELVDENLSLEDTAAGQVIVERMDSMERTYKQQLLELTSQMQEEKDQAAEEKKLMRIEIGRLRQAQATLQEEQAEMSRSVRMKAPDQSGTFRGPVKAKILVRLESSYQIDPDDIPPPYSPKRAPHYMTAFFTDLRDIVELALVPIDELRQLVGPYVAKALRPRLQTDHSRIEWTCSLAAELRGRVISGPAILQAPAGPSSTPPQPPSQAHLQGNAPSASSSRSAGPPRQPYAPAQQASTNTAPGGFNAGTTHQTPTANKWLEVCIRSSADISILAEIDIAGAHNDQSVFDAIRYAYVNNRVPARLFGSFAYRIPTGGGPVMFRKDKLVNRSTGKPPTFSIMQRQCMPNATDAQQYHYTFDPVPMDEPAIDTRTFHHYLQNPHDADPSQAWMKRFPQLNDSSLFYKPEKLAKGWGLEITEDRNWMLFVVASIVILLVSGAVAGIYAWRTDDKTTGVAIGAWLTAVQMLSVTLVFWRWTD
ncbi:hypothetical protein LTR02_010448 [Friedmanniomyces endolithicus]|nr:hypothetical protein LTR02_010448 [Friedmanniomyces endolithicus]